MKKTDIEASQRYGLRHTKSPGFPGEEYVSQQLWLQVPHAASFCAIWKCLYTDSKCPWT